VSTRDYLPSPREWVGFAVWIIIVSALVYYAVKWRDWVSSRHSGPVVTRYEPVKAPSVAPASLPVAKPSSSPTAVITGPRSVPRSAERRFRFYTLEAERPPLATAVRFLKKGHDGVECVNPNAERAWILSEYQKNFRAPESGCGVTAVLDWVIWYQGVGLIPRSTQHSDLETYKRITFDLIDRKIAELRGRYRGPGSGANISELIVAFDSVVRELSGGKIRLHHEIKQAPLSQRDLLEQTRSYRAGILIVRVYDPKTPPMGGYHAVALVRTDTTGRVSIANWGKYEHGRLVDQPDGQWFKTEDGSQPPTKVESLVTLVPFYPKS
jgi:hypothetical protein